MTQFAALPGTDLESVNATAELLTRTDRKYVLPDEGLDQLLVGLSDLRVLDVAGRRDFRYESTYFDTTDLGSWSGSAHPRRRRWKVRTRVYADSGDCWLEVKTRGSRGSTVKERLEYDLDKRHEIDEDAAAWIAGRLQAACITWVEPRELVPTLHTHYHRSTILMPGGGGRATFDSGLSWGSAFGTAEVSGGLVVETKTTGRASLMDHRLWQLGVRPTRISKYGTGLALLTPGLPGNRWHRVTHRDLANMLTVSQIR